jgi:hypothetical protein
MLAWRGIGIFGYAVVFPVTCIALDRAFSPPADALPLGVSAQDELVADRS